MLKKIESVEEAFRLAARFQSRHRRPLPAVIVNQDGSREATQLHKKVLGAEVIGAMNSRRLFVSDALLATNSNRTALGNTSRARAERIAAK